MANDYSKVSLGFAEFVSQLIHETFDAILDSQNYQIDKFLSLERALNTSLIDFKNKYLTDEEINEYIFDEIGFELKENISLTSEQALILSNILLKAESKQLIKTKLTPSQFILIYDYILEKLVKEKKSKIQMFVERPEMARLFIDSGEIKAKLNLSFLNEDLKDATSSTDKNLNTPGMRREDLVENKKHSFEVKKIDFSKIQTAGRLSNIKVNEIIDKDTGSKILLIDKEILKNKEVDFNIPTTRIIANPINNNSSTSISSEVIIKFRSI